VIWSTGALISVCHSEDWKAHFAGYQMRRREFITLLGGAAAAWPLVARAQRSAKVSRIGFLASGLRPVSIESSQYGGFAQGMRELGHVEGVDFVMEWRFAEGRPELYPALAAELARAQVDIAVAGNAMAVRPMQQASSSIPIVVAVSTDPVGLGLVASLAHPGGNVTGLATSADDTASKQLALLTSVMPKLSRVGFLSSPDHPNSAPVLRAAQVAALNASLQLIPVEARTQDDLENALAALAKERVEALMLVPGGVFNVLRSRLAHFALHAGLPTIASEREFVEAGGLMSYGESAWDLNRRAAFYVDKIMKGAKPADLPVQQPTRFLLTINRKTADALGLNIPPELLATADEVIE
jgi:putative ABC transport system substrate-binding protein